MCCDASEKVVCVASKLPPILDRYYLQHTLWAPVRTITGLKAIYSILHSPGMPESIELIILPYTAVFFSIIARFIFMYLLYSKKSTNIYSLTFCCLSIISSSIWIPYGVRVGDTPIIVRSGVETILLSTSGLYIIRNRCMSRVIENTPDSQNLTPPSTPTLAPVR